MRNNILLKKILTLFIAILFIFPLFACSQQNEETVTVEIGGTLPNIEGPRFLREYRVFKDQIKQKLISAEYTKTNHMTDDFEAARIIFDEDSEKVLLLAFDYGTDVLYAQYADDIYIVENYEQLVSFICSLTNWNQYTLLSGLPNFDGEISEANGSTVYWEGSWRVKKYFYNSNCSMENVYIYNETSENTVKTQYEILDKSIGILEIKEKYIAYMMYDETSDMWLVEIYPDADGSEDASVDVFDDGFYDVVLDMFGNVLWIDSPWGLEVLKKP